MKRESSWKKEKRKKEIEEEEQQKEEGNKIVHNIAAKSPEKKLTFKQKQEENRKKRREKKTQGAKCYVCGQKGHVRRECPGIPDGGKGQSIHKSRKANQRKRSERGQRKKSPDNQGMQLYEYQWPRFEFSYADAKVNLEADRIVKEPTLQRRSVFLANDDNNDHSVDDLIAEVLNNMSPFDAANGNLKCWIHCAYLRLYDTNGRKDNCTKSVPAQKIDNENIIGKEVLESVNSLPKPHLVVGWSEPKLCHDFTEESVEEIVYALSKPNVVGIVTGLDFSSSDVTENITNKKNKMKASAQQQLRCFSAHLDIAVKEGKPILVTCPSPDAEADLCRVLLEKVPRDNKIHLSNCCSVQTVTLLLNHFENLFLGISGRISHRSGTPYRELAFDVPLNRLLLESNTPLRWHQPHLQKTIQDLKDLPEMANLRDSLREQLENSVAVQYPHKEIPNSPSHCLITGIHIAKEKRISLEEVVKTSFENLKAMYDIRIG